jgi:hypothetical protein
VFTYHCAYCSNLFLASTHDFSALPKRKDPGLDHAIIVPLPPPPKSEEESDSSSSEESSSDEEEDEPEEQAKPAEPRTTKKPEAPIAETRGKEVAEEVRPAAPATPQEKADVEMKEAPTAQPSEKAPETNTTPAAATSPAPATSMAPPPAPSTTLPADSAPATTTTLQTREKDDYTLILSLTKDRTAQIITREDGFEKRWIWRCGRCRIISGYQLDDAHFDPPGSTGQSETMDEKEKKRTDRKRKRYLYILPGAVLPTEELGRELKEKEIDVLGVEI